MDALTPHKYLHPLLRQRWSPRVFDCTLALTSFQVDLLLEAARWAPSAGNSQQWAFVTARRGDPVHRRVLPHLAGSSALWAGTASLLVLNVCHLRVDDSEIEYSEFSSYDLGQTVAHLTVQATAMGLSARQFRAFDRLGMEQEFTIGAGWQLATITAVGSPMSTPEPGARPRRPDDQLRWPGAATAERT